MAKPFDDLLIRNVTRASLVALAVVATFSGRAAAAGAENIFAPVDRSESRAAQEELMLARRALVDAQLVAARTQRTSQMDDTSGSTRRVLEHNAAEACSHFNAVRRPVLAAVHSDSTFRTLDADREAARAAIRELASNGQTGSDKVIDLALRALEAGRRMSRAELIAVALDPAVEDARIAMTEAFAELRVRVVAFQNSNRPTRPTRATPMPTEIDLVAARQRVDDANRHLADALMREEANEQYRAMRLKQMKTTPTNPWFAR